MRFDVRREERSVEDELGRASGGRNHAGAPEEGGATERERVSSRKGHDWWRWWSGGLTRHEVRGAERKLAEGEEDGDAVGWQRGEGLEEERRVARSARAGVKVQAGGILQKAKTLVEKQEKTESR